jgi:hypothetical protein
METSIINITCQEISTKYHCSDEKTGIQALERKTELAKPGRVEKRKLIIPDTALRHL